MPNQKKAYLFAFAAIACWSTIGSAFKLTLRYLDPLGLLFYSSFVACLVVLLLLLTGKKIHLVRNVTRRELIYSAFLGLLNPFFYYVVLLKSYDLLPAQEAGTLNYIWPLVLVLLSIPMLKQKTSVWSLAAILISFLGILLIATHGDLVSMDFSNPVGVLLALSSAVFWALYWIFNLKDQRDTEIKLFLSFCFGFFYSALAFFMTGVPYFPSWPGIAGAVYIGIFEMGITFALWLNALKYSVTTAKVSNLIYLSPFISLIIIHILVKETILPTTIAGLIMIVGGILLQQNLKNPK